MFESVDLGFLTTIGISIVWLIREYMHKVQGRTSTPLLDLFGSMLEQWKASQAKKEALSQFAASLQADPAMRAEFESAMQSGK